MSRVLPWVAGLAAIVLTASGEYALYVACGFGSGWAAAGPVCIDAYVLAAVHARREVLFAVLVMVGTNATAHLLPAGGPPVPVVVAVAALAPVVLWRVHALAAGSARQTDGTLPGAGNRSDPATVDEPVFTLTRENPGGPLPWEASTLTTDEGAWSAPWEGEPWPPLNRGEPATVPALGSRSDIATTGLAVVGLAPTTGAKVIDEGASAAVDTPAGDQSGYQGGDHRVELEPVVPVVTGVVTTAVAEHDVSSPEPVGSGDQPDDHTAPVEPMTEAEVRRAARALNRRTVKATGRPVTVAALQAEYALSRRAATDLRRELVAAG